MSNYYLDDGKDWLRAFIYGLGILIVCLIIMFLAASCSPVKRIGGLSAKHPDAAREVFVSMFPPVVSTVTNTEYLPGKEITTYDTVTVDCDSVMAAYHVPGSGNKINTKYVRVPCPPSSVRVDTLLKTVTKTVVNTSKEKQLQTELDKMTQERDRVKGGRNNWRWIGLAGIVLVLGTAAFKFLKGKWNLIGGLFKKKS